ncbi:hypothetical protein [Nannocystis sp.]|uniref:hypothetical protein n=1 Tax=Nannocystis sp. TaxID=1962667 RepID=UPI0025E5A917|nr:hypothetical protein [Nannocystis sp.]MBK7829363.1 hypothetical protein [Nannocystis sp.]
MRSCTLMVSLLALLLAGCIQGLLDEGDGLVSITATVDVSSSSSTGEPSTPTTSAGSEVQTVTGDEESTAPSTTSSAGDPGSSSGDPVNLPPTIELFDVVQDHLDEAGPADLQLIASDDVVKVRLTLDGEKLADLTLADFPRTWDVLSAKDNGPERKFKVVVEDAEGLTAEAEDKLSVLLPQSGAERCIFKDPVDGAVLSIISALTYTPKGEILAVGTRGPPGALRLTAWMIDPKSCQSLPGWPKSLENWSEDDGFKKTTSFGTAVALDEDGNLIVAGNFLVANEPQGYVALLNSSGSLLWEKAGQVGDEITSVAAGTAQFSNRVFVGGAQRTSDNPVRTDGAVWVYIADGESVFIQPPTMFRAPFTPDEFDLDLLNERREWVRALVMQPSTGNVLAVGEREFSPNDVDVFSRTFTARLHPLAGVVGTPWTSTADASFIHDAARSVTVCGDGFVAGGWTRDLPVDAKPQPMIFWLGDDGAATQHRAEPQLPSTQINGIVCDREGKIVGAGVRSMGPPDAQVFAVWDPFGPRIPYDAGVIGEDGAAAVACDSWGFCAWGGYRTANAKPYAVIRVHHP